MISCTPSVLEQEHVVPRQGLKLLRVLAMKFLLLFWSPCLDSPWVQQAPEKFHSSLWEDAIRWAQSLLPPESQDLLNIKVVAP